MCGHTKYSLLLNFYRRQQTATWMEVVKKNWDSNTLKNHSNYNNNSSNSSNISIASSIFITYKEQT